MTWEGLDPPYATIVADPPCPIGDAAVVVWMRAALDHWGHGFET